MEVRVRVREGTKEEDKTNRITNNKKTADKETCKIEVGWKVFFCE